MTVATGIDAQAASAELLELFERLRRAGRDDPAWCVAHAGAFMLGDATPPPVGAYAREYRLQRPRRVHAALDDSMWAKLLYHPSDDLVVGKIFEAVVAAARRVFAQPIERFGFAPREALSPSSSSIAVVRALGTAAGALRVPVPLVFARRDRPGGLAHIPSEPIASVAGSGLLSGWGLHDLAFLAAHHMTAYRADHYARVVCPTNARLGELFDAAIRLGRPHGAARPPPSELFDRLAEVFGADRTALDLVRSAVHRYDQLGLAADVARWRAGTERTALRAGLLLCGDLEVAARLLAVLPGVPADSLADLTTFAMSEAYFALRQRTGLALWPDGERAHSVAEERPSLPEIARDDVAATRASSSPGEGSAGVDVSALRSVEIELEPDASFTDATALASVEISLDEPAQDRVPTSPRTARELWAARVASADHEAAYLAALVALRYAPRDGSAEIRAYLAAQQFRASWPAGSRVRSDAWSVLRDHGELTATGRLIETLAPVIQAAVARTPEQYGFERHAAVRASAGIARSLQEASYLLDTPATLVFEVDTLHTLATRPPCDPAITIVDASAAARLSLEERSFIAARLVANDRWERVVRRLIPSPEFLGAIVRGVVAVLAREVPPPGLPPVAARIADALARDPVAREQATDHVRAIGTAEAIDHQVLEWCRAADRTALRVAFFAMPSFDAAESALARDEGPTRLIDAPAAISLLEHFALTPELASARRSARAS